jgi:hypothetical protein
MQARRRLLLKKIAVIGAIEPTHELPIQVTPGQTRCRCGSSHAEDPTGLLHLVSGTPGRNATGGGLSWVAESSERHLTQKSQMAQTRAETN